ncbi:MAG: DNA repair protein RecO [Alphaproteobacteria bacterium]|nr:DNA repair protein RecO [Alphaproteobacteria bacterium]
MKLESVGILVSLRPLNERDALAYIFSRDYGMMAGVLRGAIIAKKNKPLIGQVGGVTWNARLDSQLGTFHWESEKNLSAGLMMNSKSLMYMNSAFELLVCLLPEREAYQQLYQETLDMLIGLVGDNKNDVYLMWEVGLLRALGYALDLSHCSGCGVTDALNFLSPRTGRAVCDACAAPYINKLYKLPLGLNVTLRFLENVCAQQGGQMPPTRQMLNFM